MQSTNNSNLLEIIDLAHSLRHEHLFIANEQDTFNQLNDDLCKNALNITKVRKTHMKQKLIDIELHCTCGLTSIYTISLTTLLTAIMDLLTASAQFKQTDFIPARCWPNGMLSTCKHPRAYAVHRSA